MLTYSYLLNKSVTIAPLKKIASAKVVTILWHANFTRLGKIISSFSDWESDYKMFNLLNTHRKETIGAAHTFIDEEKNLPRIFETFFEESICSLCQAYSDMLLWRLQYDADCKISLLDKNKLFAPNYFTVNEGFNDLAWSKRVVLDPNYPLDSRFYLACLYWLENESAILWSALKNSDLVPCNGNLSSIQEEMHEIVTIMIFHLENKLEILAQNPKYAGNLYKVGFEKAVEECLEYSAYYFWQKVTEQEKKNITGNVKKYYSSLYYLHDFGFNYQRGKISYFLYSQLSKEQRKEVFLDKTIGYDSGRWIVALLLSPYTEEVRSELIGFAYELPIHLYSEILENIALVLKQAACFSFLLHGEVFEVLWNNLSPQHRDEVLRNPICSSVQELIEAKSFS